MSAHPRLFLIVGDDEYLVTRAVSHIKDQMRRVYADCDPREHAAESLTPGLLDEALSPPLFGGMPLVLLRDVHTLDATLTQALLGHLPRLDDVVLILTHAGGVRGRHLQTSLKEAGATLIPAAKITKHRDLLAFIRDEIQAAGGRCRAGAAEELLAVVGRTLRDLASACHQLVHDAGDEITLEIVQRHHRGRADITGFTIADAILVGDLPRAYESLRWALAAGLDPVPIADALADGVRTVARVAGVKRNPADLASSLGLPPWRVEKAQHQARGWSAGGLTQAVRIAANLNAEVKGGSDDRQYALETALRRLAAARA